MSAFVEVSDIAGSRHLEVTEYAGLYLVRILGQHGGERLTMRIAADDFRAFLDALRPIAEAEEGEG